MRSWGSGNFSSYLFSYRQKCDKLESVNPKQMKIVESRGVGQAVVAGAGCGKTTTLVARCKALMNRQPGARFCAVSFTEKSVRDLREALLRGMPDLDFSEHWIKTIHGLCSSILREFPAQAGLQGGERIILEEEATRLWERSLSVLWTSTENPEISEAVERLLSRYARSTLEGLLLKLRSLESFGVESFITRSFDREEVRDLWLVFESVHRRFQQAKSREGVLDFNDLEGHARIALRAPEVRRHYQERFDLVLVDEFQDTNPVQGEILEAFVRPDFSNLTIVGDPKQSIYRFRDADVSVFQDLVRKLPETHLLDINYRSRPGIIEFVNQVCAPVFECSGLPYEPLVPGREDSAQEQRVFRLEWDTAEDLAQFFLARQAAGVDLSEFVVLVRSIRKEKTRTFIAALEKFRIPFLLGSGGRFYEDPRVREGVAFLKGWLSPKNRLSQAVALRSPWIGISDTVLLRWAGQREDKSRVSFFERFFEESPHPVARALAEVYRSQGRISRYRPGEILERILALDSLDEEWVQPLASLWHKCEELSRQGRRFPEIVRFLTRAIEEARMEREVPVPAERGMIRILTVHGSKGLQFPRVVLLDFDGEYRGGGSPDLIWDRSRGVHLFERDEEGHRIKEGSANLAWAELEKRAAVAESKRVFYVALTRPQEELILAWKREVRVRKSAEEPDYVPGMTDHWREWVEAFGLPPVLEFQRDQGASSGTEGQLRVDVPRLMNFDPEPYRSRHSPSEWLVLEKCPLWYHFEFCSEVSPGSERSSSEEVALQGKRIHEKLEHEDWAGLISEFDRPGVGEAVVECLQSHLGRSDLGVKVVPEAGFEIPLSSVEALVGMMDRLEVDPVLRRIRIIDFKYTSGSRSPGQLFRQYGLQLRLYAYAALRLVGDSDFEVEAAIAHFSQDQGLQWLPLPPEGLNARDLEAEVRNWFDRARMAAREAAPTPGDHCRYCAYRTRCPAQQDGL